MAAIRVILSDLIRKLKDKAIDHSEYFHYTRLCCYKKMMKPVQLPENGGVHRMLWLTPATNTNDGKERDYGKHAYLGCFTYSPYENVGMWFMYGRRRSDAIRIGFTNAALKAWLCKAEGFIDYKERVYGVEKKGRTNIYTKIPASAILDFSFYDVAYVLSRDEIEHHNWDGNVEWHRYYYRVICDDNQIASAEDKIITSDDFTKRACEKLPFCFKKKGWSGEREVRLVVMLKPELAGRFHHVAVPFDEPLEFINKNESSVVTSPWLSDEEFRRFKGKRYTSSAFRGELNLKDQNSL